MLLVVFNYKYWNQSNDIDVQCSMSPFALSSIHPLYARLHTLRHSKNP
ncbi:hypothetical protein SDC9_129629 [bioreactor metagenome]|uniref:Uncharacterized protein n=1 Tax=bioreactor metagenome TaxID=1076179 RepID=A0A645D0C9_9ZZZZ